MRWRISTDVRENDDIVLRSQIAITKFLIGEIGVRHAVIIERGAYPAFVLRALPGVNVAYAGDIEVVRFHAGRGGNGDGAQAEITKDGLDFRAVGVRNNERAHF